MGRAAAAAVGVPRIIHTFHGHTFHSYFSPWKEGLVIRSERFLSALSTDIIGISSRICRELAVRYRICPQRKLRRIPLGFDLEKFAADEDGGAAVRKELGIRSDALVTGFSGRLVPVKDPLLFVDTARELADLFPDMVFLVCGDGEMKDAVSERITERGLTDRFVITGWRQDPERCLRAMDVMLLTSRNEGTPAAVIEAMAAGIPVTAAAVGGLPDLVCDNRTGLLVSGRSPAAFAQRISTLIKDMDLRQRIIKNARLSSAGYSAERLLRNMDRLYCRNSGER